MMKLMKYIFGLLVLAANVYGWTRIYRVGEYVVRTSLFRPTTVSAPAPAPARKTATVSADALNMRTGPSVNDDIAVVIHRGDTITILENNADTNWVKVEYGSQTGYVHKDFITINGEE